MNKIFVVLAIAIVAASCKSLRFLEAESMRNLVDIKGACNIVNAISDTYKKIVSAFKSRTKSTIVSTAIKDGFAKFAGSGKTKVIKGIKEETGWEKFKKNTLKNMKLPQNTLMKLKLSSMNLNTQKRLPGTNLIWFSTLIALGITANSAQLLSTTEKKMKNLMSFTLISKLISNWPLKFKSSSNQRVS